MAILAMNKSNEKLDGFSVWTEPKGYKAIWINGKSIKAHIYVWEKHNGPKPKGYDIHHIDEDKANYSIDNLELLSKSDHQKVHAGWVRELGVWVAKPCNKCCSVKPLSEFYPRKGYEPTALCKPCHCEQTHEWAKKNRIKRRKIALDYYYRNKNKGGEDNG